MAILLSDELRLLYAAALLLVPWVCAYQLSRRLLASRIEAAGAAFLLLYAIQYLSICVPGLLGLLTPISIAVTALVLTIAVGFAAWRARGPAPTRSYDSIFTAIFVFLVAYVAALIHHQAFTPVISNDALTYHLPAAVQWLQTHRLNFYDAWFYNPANSYSPLAGSTFIAYLLAPMGNDVLARFVEAPALLFLFFTIVSLMRRLNVSLWIAGIIALATVLSRPFISQTILAKDDLFLAAFAIAAVNAMASNVSTQRRSAPILAGAALGMFFATKYTAFFSLPIFLFAIDLPRKNGWHARDYAVAGLIALVLAGPWYARNWVLTGNPIYPTDVRVLGVTILPGMFHAIRSHLLASPQGVWTVFTSGYYSIPIVLAIVIVVAWFIAVAMNARDLRNNPLLRALLIGAPLSILLFVLASPYGEIRFTYPAVVLLFACIALVLMKLPKIVRCVIAIACLIFSCLTAFPFAMASNFTWIAAVVAIIGAGICYLSRRERMPRVLKPAAIALACLVIAIAVYVHWHAYIAAYRDEGTYAVWSAPTVYDGQAELWRFIREKTPPASTIAYTNTYLVYPLMGFDLDRPITYIPTRRNLKSFADLPRIAPPITGEQIPAHILDLMRADPDHSQWLANVLKSNADYLYISTINPARPDQRIAPPELSFVASSPKVFERVFPPTPNPAIPGMIYHIHCQ